MATKRRCPKCGATHIAQQKLYDIDRVSCVCRVCGWAWYALPGGPWTTVPAHPATLPAVAAGRSVLQTVEAGDD